MLSSPSRHLATLVLALSLSLSRPHSTSAARSCKLARSRQSAFSSGGGGGGCKASADPKPGRIATTWYAGWLGTQFTPQDVSWEKYTEVIYAFAVTTPDVNTIALQPSDEQLLPTFVSSAHQNNVKASLSIGGWTGSQYFSTAVATEQNRTAFVRACLGLVSKYGFDGLDFDWEYPNRQGVGCNTISPSDSANFIAFLQELRADPLGEQLTISAAAGLTPFMGPDGTPLDDVSQFAAVFDFVTIMNYDVWGAWLSPSLGVGPNAPLNDTCAPSQLQQGSAVRAVDAWTAAGFPASKLVLGVPAYGRSFRVATSDAFASPSVARPDPPAQSPASSPTEPRALAPYPPFDASDPPSGDRWDGAAGVDQCGNAVPPGGIWDFWGLVEGGFLNSDGKVASGGSVGYRFDSCSQTPYVYNPTTQVMVTYDDAQSFTAKGNFIASSGLAGFAMWHAAGDSDDILLDAIGSAIKDGGGEKGGAAC